MVANVTSLTGNGVRDWLIQRLSSIVLAFYSLFLLFYFFCHSPVSYEDWHILFTHMFMKVFSILALFSLVSHAWIGIWTVTTDYLSCVCLRLSVQALFAVSLLGYLVWGFLLFWS